MKKFSILLIAIIFIASACGGGKKEKPLNIIGKWQLKSIEGAKLNETERKTTFEFKIVGKDIQKYSIKQGNAKQSGNWLLGGKTLQLIPQKGSAHLLKNIQLKSGVLSFDDEGKKISLQRKK